MAALRLELRASRGLAAAHEAGLAVVERPFSLQEALAAREAMVTSTTAFVLPVVAPLAGLGLLAAGVVALIDRLRRVQLRQRRPGRIPTPPPASAARTVGTCAALPPGRRTRRRAG